MKVFILLLFCLSLAESKNYTNYHLLKVKPTTQEGLEFLKNLEANYPFDYDFWIPPTNVNRFAEVLLPLKAYNNIKDYMKDKNINVNILSENIQSGIDKEKDVDRSYVTPSKTDKYMFIQFIEILIQSFADNYDHVSMMKYGKSHENRDLHALKFSVGPGRKTIVVETGMHGRDWIAIASTLKVIEHMATKLKTDSDVKQLLNNFDWVFIPVANPDGYHSTYTWDRLWKKNTKRDSSGTRCVGVDLNRNFDVKWGGEGSSSDPCHRSYRGSRKFSEQETVFLSKFVRTIRDKLAYFSVHAYSQLILTPYACKTRKPKNNDHLIEVAGKVKRAIYEENGSRYFVGSPQDIFHSFTGSSYDWAKMKMNIKYSYALKVGPESFNGKGFIVPESEIGSNFRELFVALKTFANNLEK